MNDNVIRIAGLVEESIVDGMGVRFVVFVQGCPHHCPGCHNPNTHDIDGGYDIEIDEIVSKIEKNPLIDGVTFSGGEPFCQAGGLAKLAKKLKKLGYNIWTYSGYTLEELIGRSKEDEDIKKLLSLIDILVDGRFEEDKMDYTLKFRGSSNQRIIEMKDIEV